MRGDLSSNPGGQEPKGPNAETSQPEGSHKPWTPMTPDGWRQSVANSVNSDLEIESPSALHELPTKKPALSMHSPFGLTVIVGGTNVRFSLSIPDTTDPIITSVTWRELKEYLTEELDKKGLAFENAKEVVFPEIGRRLVEFVAENSPPDCTPPFHNICAFNFSVAGGVEGAGLDSTVTTSNTGISLKREALARGIIGAINDELRGRDWPPMRNDAVYVLNDAIAGAFGECSLGALQGVEVGVFVIIGTGIGGITLKQGQPYLPFSEFGYTIISSALDGARKYIVTDGSKLLEQLDENGNFPDPPKGQSYIQNYLAGPWFAINFVRQYNRKAGEPEPDWRMLQALASKISSELPGYTKEDLTNQLLELSELDWRKRQSWAVSSSSLIIRAINSFLLLPDGEAVLDALPCTGGTEEWRVKEKAELVLTYDAYRYWKGYFKDIGTALGALSREMTSKGMSPGRIVLGGGISEACERKLAPRMKERALTLIHHHARLKAGTVVLSTMSPEARESALATQLVQEANEAHKARAQETD
jgi:hypothetical protein